MLIGVTVTAELDDVRETQGEMQKEENKDTKINNELKQN